MGLCIVFLVTMLVAGVCLHLDYVNRLLYVFTFQVLWLQLRTVFLVPHVSFFFLKSCRTNETKQLAAVLSHPQFKANPFAAIQQHLAITIPVPTPEPIVKAPAKAGSEKKKKKKK